MFSLIFLMEVNYLEKLINLEDTVKQIVLGIREQLAKEYDLVEDYKDYSGLCDEAYIRFKREIESLNVQYNTDFEVLHFHGEQSHSPRIDQKHWSYQHTWTGIKLYGKILLYVDPTSQQFKDIYPDISDYYISPISPPWYYSDRENPRYNGWTGYLNDRIIIKHKHKFSNGETRKVKDGIIEFCQYEIWGRISNLIRKILRKGE